MKLLISFVWALSVTGVSAFVPNIRPMPSIPSSVLSSTTEEQSTRTDASSEKQTQNVLQTENTSRESIMTFSYDMSLEPKYEKPSYPGTGNGLSGDSGEYDVIVIGSGMGGLTCGALR